MEKQWKQRQTLFCWVPKSLWMVTAGIKLKDACSLEEKQWQKQWPRQHIKKQRHYFANNCPYSQSYDFSSTHVRIWELDNKKGWALKNRCLQTVVVEKTLESPLDSKKIKPVNPKGNQPWIVTEGLMLKLKLQYFGHLMWQADSLEKTLMLGKTKGRQRRGQ